MLDTSTPVTARRSRNPLALVWVSHPAVLDRNVSSLGPSECCSATVRG